MLVLSNTRYLLFLAIFALLLTLSSCALKGGGVRGDTNAVTSEAIGINKAAIPKAHLWTNLYKYDEEEDGFATYTYVLVGRDASHKLTQDKYLTLINAITSSISEKEQLPNVALKSKYNLFLIPVIKEGIEPSRPNEKLSMLLLTALSTFLPGKFDAPGPYLITLAKPIRFGHIEEVADILILDLSDKNPGAIREYVRAYKERLIDKRVAGVEKLQSLRVALLDTALNTEDSLRFARVTFGELQKIFITAWSYDSDMSFRSKEANAK
jgi:hypothetical protein